MSAERDAAMALLPLIIYHSPDRRVAQNLCRFVRGKISGAWRYIRRLPIVTAMSG